MTEDEFREKMKELGWNDEEIDEYIEMYHWALAHGMTTVSLEDYVGKKAIITSYTIQITDFKDL